MSDIESIRNLSSSYVVWLILMPLISSFCYQFDGIFIGASQTKELRNAMIFSVFSLFINIFIFNKNNGQYWNMDFLVFVHGVKSVYLYFII